MTLIALMNVVCFNSRLLIRFGFNNCSSINAPLLSFFAYMPPSLVFCFNVNSVNRLCSPIHATLAHVACGGPIRGPHAPTLISLLKYARYLALHEWHSSLLLA